MHVYAHTHTSPQAFRGEISESASLQRDGFCTEHFHFLCIFDSCYPFNSHVCEPNSFEILTFHLVRDYRLSRKRKFPPPLPLYRYCSVIELAHGTGT